MHALYLLESDRDGLPHLVFKSRPQVEWLRQWEVCPIGVVATWRGMVYVKMWNGRTSAWVSSNMSHWMRYNSTGQHLWWWSQGWQSNCRWNDGLCWSLAFPPTGSCLDRAQPPTELGHTRPTHQLHKKAWASKKQYIRLCIPCPCVSASIDALKPHASKVTI